MSDVIANANARADDMVATAETYVDELGIISENDIATLNYGGTEGTVLLGQDYAIPFEYSTIAEANAVSDITTVIKQFSKLDSISVAKPDANITYYNEQKPGVWDAVSLPTFTENVPTVNAPNLPETNSFTAPEAYFTEGIGSPEWEDKDAPTEIELAETSLAAPNALDLDSVDLTVPQLNVVAPANTFEYAEESYSSGLLTSIQTLLSSDIENGGYGIEQADEEQLYARGREREAKKAAMAVTQARKGIAARGFPVPPGSLYATERVILQENTVALGVLNREIVLKRSELYVQARQFAVQQGLTLEQTLITYVGAKQERSLRALQSAADFVIKHHNIAVGLFELKTQITRLQLDIHKEQLASASVRLQEYGQQLAYADRTDKRNEIAIQNYNSKLNGLKLHYEGQQIREGYLNLLIKEEQLKIDANKSQVSVYAVQVKAATDEYQLYNAQWQGEKIKQDVFTQKVTAHDRLIEAKVKEVQIEKDRFMAEIDLLKVSRERKVMALEENKLRISKATALDNNTRVENQENFDKDKANADVEKFNVSTALQQRIEQASKFLETYQTNITDLSTNIDSAIKSKQLRADAATKALELYRDGLKNELIATSAIVTSTAV